MTDVVIVSAARTPLGRFMGDLSLFSAHKLGSHVIAAALERAKLSPDKIGYVNAHATSTPLGDALESAAMKKLFGERALSGELPVSSTKSMTGHLLGGAGGLEAGITVMALIHQTAPPTTNLVNQDPACELHYVPNKPQPIETEYALSNSFGFGGTNGSLVFKRWHE